MTRLHHHHDHHYCRSSRRSAGTGYTLIELLIVVAILGLSSVLLVPYLVNRDSMNVQAAVRLIIGDLTFAQSDALAHQEIRRVHFYEDGRGYCLTRVDDAALSQPFDEDSVDYVHDPLASGGDEGDYIVDLANDRRFRGVSITTATIDGNTFAGDGSDLHFDHLGGTVTYANGPGTGGIIVVESGEETYEISIAPFTGKISVRKL